MRRKGECPRKPQPTNNRNTINIMITNTVPGTPPLPLRRIQPIGSAAAVTCYLKT